MLCSFLILGVALTQTPRTERLAPVDAPAPAAATAVDAGVAAAFDAFAAAGAGRGPGAEDERARARRAVLALPAAAVRDHLRALADGAPSEAERRAALELYALVGRSADVAAALRLYANGLDALLSDALHGIATRDSGAFTALETQLARAPAAIRSIVLGAIERVGTPAASASLGRCVEHGYGGRSEAIARLGRMALALREDLPDGARSAVRTALLMSDHRTQRDAIVAAGRMRDSEAVPQLIALLEELDPAVQSDAAWALGRITGLSFGVQPERWRSWHAYELAWWEEESLAAFEALRRPERRARIVALIDISRLHLRRPELVREVAPLLEHEDVACASLAARVLGRLGCDTAVPALARALDRGSEDVVASAWQALKRITGKELPPDRAAWLALPRS